nr:DUF4352 domain-containing protein [Bacillus pinisoli]
MKKQVMIVTLLLVFLIGCSPTALNDNAAESNHTELDMKAYEEYLPNPQVPSDDSLQKVNDTVTDEKGELTLKQIKHVNKTYNLGDIELRIIDVKVMHLVPDYSLIDYFHTLTHDEEFDFVKVFVEITNTSDEKMNVAPVAIFKTSTGENVPWENDIYLDGLNGEIEGNSKRLGNLGFIIEESDIDYIEITTSDLFNEEEEKVSKAEKIKIEF